MKYLLVKNINELIDKPLHSPCIIYETDNEKVRYEDYGNTMFYFNELDGKLVATPYKITLKKDTFEDSDIIDILDILEVEGPTTNLRFKINDSRFLLKNNTIIPRVAHVETDLELTVYTKYTEETFILHIVCEDDLQIIREFKNVTYPDTIEGYLNKITITYTEVVTITNALGTKKVESEEVYDHYFVPNVNTDHTTEDFGTNEDTIESKTREVYLKFNGEDYYLGTITQKNKSHKETWCYHTDNTVEVFNLELSLYDGVSWNNMDMVNTYRLIVGSTVTLFFGLMVPGSPVNTIIFEDTINDSAALANTTAGLENLKKVVCKGLAYGNSSSASNLRINVEEIYLLGNDTTLRAGLFAGCNAIKKLVLPKTLTAIPDGLCNNDSNLSSITLYDNITSIGNSSFTNCILLENINIPNSVISIAQSAFHGCSGLLSVTIPNSVISIGSSAFNGCSGMTSVYIGNSVTSIGGGAFYGCTGELTVNCNTPSTTTPSYGTFYGSGFTSVIIGDKVAEIGAYAFCNCSNLFDVTIGNSVTSIGYGAFEGCTSMTSVTIGNSVTSIGTLAFHDCSGLTSVTIPNSVRSIENSAFSGCSSLTSIDIPNSVTIIEGFTFLNCSSLTSVIIPNSVTSIREHAFFDCYGLTSVAIPNSVTIIGASAFYGCSGLTSVTIPNSVTSIGDCAFDDCSGLKDISIGNSILEIGSTVFEGCTNITNLRIEDGNNPINLPIVGNSSLLTLYLGRTLSSNSYPFANITTLASVTIGNSVTIIRSSAFSNCGIEELEFPDSVETIEYSVATNCPNLKRVKLSANLKSVCTGFCVNCPNLDTVNDEYLKATLPDSLTTLSEESISAIPFVGTKIKTLVIPKNITSYLSTYTSGNNPNIETCILHCKDAIEKGNVNIWAFFMLHVKKVFIPEDCKYCKINLNSGSDYYKDISLNTDEPNVLKLPDAYTGEFGLGSMPTNLKEVILSEHVTSLGNYVAFSLSDNLETVDLKNVHTINANILNYRTKLDYIKLSKNITSISYKLFESYASSRGNWGFLEIDWDIIDFLYPSTGNLYSLVPHLLKLNIGENTKLLSARFSNQYANTSYYPCILDISDGGSYIDIANRVFSMLPTKSLHIPERVQSIAPESFNSTFLESITVDPNNNYYTDYNRSNVLVDKIDNSLLLGCANSTIPEGVVRIHKYAFYNCKKLYELEIPETIVTLNDYSMLGCKNLGLLKIKNRSTLNIEDYVVDTSTNTQVVLDVVSVPTISSVSFRLGNDHKIYIPKNLESAFKANTNWAKLNLVPCESFDTFTVKVTVNVGALGTPIIANIGEVLPLSIKVDGEPTSLVGDLKYYNTLGEHTLELTYLSALHLGIASESIVHDLTNDAGANTIVNIEYLDTNSIEEKTTKSQLLDTTTENSTYTLNTDPYSEYGVVTVYYDILNITSATRLFSSHYNNVCAITVDGESVSSTRALYWFTTPGIHTVKYYFYNKYHCFEYGNAPMFVGVEGISKIEIGESFNFIYRYLLSNATIGSLQINSSNPPVITGNGSISLSYPIYVPAESVEMYKTSSYGWSTYADNIQAIP